MNKIFRRLSERRVDVLLSLATGVVFAVVAVVSSLETALASGVTFGVFSAIIQAKWEMRRHTWFWVVISVFAVIHVVGIIIINFPEPRFGLVTLPFALADGFIMWGILSWIDKRFQQAPNGGD